MVRTATQLGRLTSRCAPEGLFAAWRKGRVRCAVLLSLYLLPALAPGADFQTPAITALDLKARQDTPEAYLVVDVRDVQEYRKGHIPGAINIPQDTLDQHLDELHNPNGVVIYCIVGRRTRLAEQTLLDNGFENVFHIERGFGGWLMANYPVMKGRKP